jgi:hypothetical protein
MMKKLICNIFIAFICLFCGVALLGHRVTLIPLEPIQISQTIDGQSNFATIATNFRTSVVRCIDTKSLIIPEIQLTNKKIGYAVFGKFKMEYASALSFSNSAPVSFSCH